MTKEEFFKSKLFKISFPVLMVILIAAMLIAIWQNGYEFGQWLYQRQAN